MVEGIARFLFQAHKLGHELIHMLCAQTSKGRQHHRLVPQPQLLPGSLFVTVQEPLLDRHSNNFYLLGMVVVFYAFLKGHQHPAGPIGNHLGGDTGHGVGLVDAGGNAHLAAGIQGREAGIAAGADDHIGLKLPKNLLTGTNGLQNAVDCVDILFQACQALFAAQAGTRKGPQLVARLGHQLFFHMTNGADKQHLAVRIAPPHFIGDGNGRIDMSGGTAAGKDKIHVFAS